MPTGQIANFKQGPGRQRGAVLMVMLVILVVSVAAILVNSLTATSLKNSRKAQTAAALAQAKEALIGYAVSDPNRPGELPCPDVNDDGKLTMNVDYIGNNCVSPIGRLPWITLGMPELRDGDGEHLWYAVSKSYWSNGNTVINSDTPGNLTVSGSNAASSVIAIVFAPGNVLSGQSRSSTQASSCTTTNTTIPNNLCATNYLEGSNANQSLPGAPNTNYQTAISSTTFNDQMIFITHDQLFQPVEKRIAREAKACLDTYALASANKYPWAALVSDIINYAGTYNTYFGRISSTPNIDITPDGPSSSAAITLSGALSTLQAALNAYNSNNSSTNQTALINAANTVISLKYNVSGISSTVDQAGDYGKYFANGWASYSTATYYNNAAVTALAQHNLNSIDPAMSPTWPASCLFTSSYWTFWQNLVFYQVANSYQPGGNLSCSACLSIATTSGATPVTTSGYHATVIVARQALPSQIPRTVTSDASYLEVNSQGTNQHQTTPSTTFVTYSPSDSNYSVVNDLVLCLNGGTSPCQ